ncbi:MAG: acetoacetate decarboxylase family protein [Promethearchaeota archaeon]
MSFKRASWEFFSGRDTIEIYGAEMLTAFWETKPEIIKNLLPSPLKPAERPYANAFIANYPKTNYGLSHLESAIFIPAEFDGEEGIYCLGMHCTNDMALVAGRETMNYPKKLGSIYINRDKRNIEAWSDRHGTRLFDIKGKLNGRLNAPDVLDYFMQRSSGTEMIYAVYNVKHFPSPDLKGFDYKPRLIKQEVVIKPIELKMGQIEMKLSSTESDPWGEVEIARVLGGVYMKSNNSMKKGEVLAELEPEEFAPYAFLKWDVNF